VRISETFVVAASADVVFDCMTDASKLASWQTSKTLVEPLTEGPTRLGTRVRERTKPPRGKEFEQVVEFTEFDGRDASASISSKGLIRSTALGPSNRAEPTPR
jgi:uncharacterized protein YndB with AHSA1/START domain